MFSWINALVEDEIVSVPLGNIENFGYFGKLTIFISSTA